jgi:hypothetical protein
VTRREQVTPILLQILEDAAHNIEDIYEQEDYMAHIYAMFLLAQFREKRSYPLVVDFFSAPGDISVEATGDVVTEYLGRILASVCRGDASLIKQLVENEAADEYVRNAALESLVCLVATGQMARQDVPAYYKSLFESGLSKEPSHFWDGLVSCCTDLYPEEIYPQIKQAFDEDLIDEWVIDLDFVDEHLALGREEVLSRLQDDRYKCLDQAKMTVNAQAKMTVVILGPLAGSSLSCSLRQRLHLLTAEARHGLPAVMHLDAFVAQL